MFAGLLKVPPERLIDTYNYTHNIYIDTATKINTLKDTDT